MERHAALPDREDVLRIGDIALQIVKQHVADPPAGDDADRRPDQEVVDVLRLQPALPGRPQPRLAISRLAYHQANRMPTM